MSSQKKEKKKNTQGYAEQKKFPDVYPSASQEEKFQQRTPTRNPEDRLNTNLLILQATSPKPNIIKEWLSFSMNT